MQRVNIQIAIFSVEKIVLLTKAHVPACIDNRPESLAVILPVDARGAIDGEVDMPLVLAQPQLVPSIRPGRRHEVRGAGRDVPNRGEGNWISRLYAARGLTLCLISLPAFNSATRNS